MTTQTGAVFSGVMAVYLRVHDVAIKILLQSIPLQAACSADILMYQVPNSNGRLW